MFSNITKICINMGNKLEEKTAIQISVKIRDLLKEFCDDNGFKMNKFAEKAILQAITGSYNITIK